MRAGQSSLRTYDAACNVPPIGSTVSIAHSGGKLGVLLTTATFADLFVCEVPALGP